MGSCCVTQRAQPSAPWQPRGVGWGRGWKAGSRGRGHMYTYCWFTLLQGRNQYIVKQLSSNLKKVTSYTLLYLKRITNGDILYSTWNSAQCYVAAWMGGGFREGWMWSRYSRVWLCATPQTAAYQAPPSLGFSTQEHWSGLPFPSPMHESEKWKWTHPVVSDRSQPHRLQPTRLLRPWDFPGKSTGVGCHCLLLEAA